MSKKLYTLAANDELLQQSDLASYATTESVTTALAAYEKTDSLTTKLATKADLVDGKIPAAQLPSYVDDVLEFENYDAFPAAEKAEAGKIYVDKATNKTYRWGGTNYVEISASLAIGETDGTAFSGKRGKDLEDAFTAYKTTNDAAVGGKADKAATLEGYGITDAVKASDLTTTLGSYVKTDTKVCGKPLTGDITLVAADVGAVAEETDPVFTAWKNGYDIAIGSTASATASGVAIGGFSKTTARDAVAIGNSTGATDIESVCIGARAQSHGFATFNINADALDKVYLGDNSLDSLINTKVSEGTTADTELNDTSKNAVQNKVIKAAIDLKTDKNTFDEYKTANDTAVGLKADKDALKTGTFDFATMKGVYEALKSVIETFGGTVTNYPTMTE